MNLFSICTIKKSYFLGLRFIWLISCVLVNHLYSAHRHSFDSGPSLGVHEDERLTGSTLWIWFWIRIINFPFVRFLYVIFSSGFLIIPFAAGAYSWKLNGKTGRRKLVFSCIGFISNNRVLTAWWKCVCGFGCWVCNALDPIDLLACNRITHNIPYSLLTVLSHFWWCFLLPSPII